MSAQGRVGDRGTVTACAHGCPACPHTATGPAIAGSPDVFCDQRPALRVGDPGVHAACCGANTWTATKGSATVFINHRPAHRKHDAQRHCGGDGELIEGSPTVMVEDPAGASSERAVAPDQLEVHVVLPNGQPAAGAPFTLALPDGALVRGTTDANGVIRLAGVPQRGEARLVVPGVDGPVTVTIGRAQQVALVPSAAR